MATKKLTGLQYKEMVINGANLLNINYKEIDALNVFPVPDGDTGTNMSMTMQEGVESIKKLNTASITEISKQVSRGLLMGARGNSGVILSQLFRGVYDGLVNISDSSANVDEFSKAFIQGYKTAYKAVINPVEGTILTVAREAAENADKHNFGTIEEFLTEYIKEAHESLKRTPDLLPALKDAGVVDSGAAGFIYVMEGMLDYLRGVHHESNGEVVDSADFIDDIDVDDIIFAYCTEFIVMLNNQSKFREADLKEYLMTIGDSIVVVQDEDIVKVHVHTNEPGNALQEAQKYGEFKKIKIENMKEQAGQRIDRPFEDAIVTDKSGPKKKFGIIAVCFGEGIKKSFVELGADFIIDGGQTMNPPTDEFVKAIEEVHAENVIIIPNNSNVILSAQQAAKLAEDVNVEVIPAKTIATGYTSLISFDATNTLEGNVEEMKEVIEHTKSGEVTYAVRDTTINGVDIKVDDFMGIAGKEIVVSVKDRIEATKKLLEKIVFEDAEIITAFVGKDVEADEVDTITNFVEENFDAEIEIIEGNQDIYSYIFAVE